MGERDRERGPNVARFSPSPWPSPPKQSPQYILLWKTWCSDCLGERGIVKNVDFQLPDDAFDHALQFLRQWVRGITIAKNIATSRAGHLEAQRQNGRDIGFVEPLDLDAQCHRIC